MYKAEKRARLTGKLYEDGAKPMMSKELDAMNVAEGAPLLIRNAAIPIVVFIIVTVAALWYTGGGMEESFTLEGLATAFGNTDAASSILYSVIFTSILCIVMAVAQKIMTLKEAIEVWMNGCKELLFTVTILMLAWSTGSVMSDLGTGAYISGLVSGSIPGHYFANDAVHHILSHGIFHWYVLRNICYYDSNRISTGDGRKWRRCGLSGYCYHRGGHLRCDFRRSLLADL